MDMGMEVEKSASMHLKFPQGQKVSKKEINKLRGFVYGRHGPQFRNV
jgi:hypothetical protein